MASRFGRTLTSWAIAAGLILAVAGATTGAGEASRVVDATNAPPVTTNDLNTSQVHGGNTSYPLRGEQIFDRGVWCTYKKVEIYDKFHKETYFVDKKVCLGTIVQ